MNRRDEKNDFQIVDMDGYLDYVEMLTKMEMKLTKCIFAAEEQINRFNIAREKPILPIDTIRFSQIATDYNHLNVVDHLTKINLLDKDKKIASFEKYRKKTNEIIKNSVVTGTKRPTVEKGPSVAKKLKMIGFDDEEEDNSSDENDSSSSSSNSSSSSSRSGSDNSDSD